MITKIDVTKQHINTGIRYNCNQCPVALALEKYINDDYICDVEGEYIEIIKKFGYIEQTIDLPNEATKFVRNFDSGQSVEPFSFELDIPDEFLRIE